MRQERKIPVRLVRSPGAFCAAGALLLGAAAAAFLGQSLLIEDPPTGFLPLYASRVLLLLGILLACELLVFLRVDLSLRARRWVSYGSLLLAAFLAFTAVELMNETNFPLWFQPETLRPRKLFGNYLCYLFLFLMLYGLCRSAFAACAVGGAVFLLFGAANYFTCAFRGSPILPWDLAAVGTAADVLGGYRLEITWPMLCSLFLSALFLCAVFSLCGGKPLPADRRRNLGERGVCLMSSILILVLLLPCNILPHLNIVVYPWKQASGMRISGVMGGFFANANYLLVEKPQGYSSQRAAELAARYKGGTASAAAKKPTVIAVMNESLTDFTREGELSCTEDYLPYIHSLEDAGEVVWGTAYAPVFGGGTCNSEYEFLTGNSTFFLPVGSRPYQQYVTSPQPSVVSTFKDLGYATVAVHPGWSSAWQRNTAYPNLGFDKFVDMHSFQVRRETMRGQTTDESNYRQVIWEYEHRDREKGFFLFNVTIQNHGGYTDEEFAATVHVKRQAGETVYPVAEQYLSLAKLSDEAFRGLTDYFSQVEEPVVILIFGDHWPQLEEEFFSGLLGKDPTSLSFEDSLRMYRIPYVIWANYPLEGGQREDTSINYLANDLFHAAGLPLTGYQEFLEQTRKTLPAVTALGFRDGEGNWYGEKSGSPYEDFLLEYETLQYNSIFDGDGRLEGFFSLSP